MVRRARALALVLLAAALAGCPRKPPPALPPLRLHATVGDAAVRVLAEAARARGLAAIAPGASAAEADLFWLGDPGEVIALGDRIPDNGAPAVEGVEERFQDARRRFAPAGARAQVLLVAPGAPFPVERLADLADPRLAGRVAVPAFRDRARAALVGALSASVGEASASRLLAALARNRPLVVEGDDAVRARLVRGEAVVGLVSSEAAASASASAAALEVVYPDQAGRGTVVLPTAIAPARGAPPAALAVAAWLASADGEALLVARVPGILPVRPGVPVPPGVRSAATLATVPLDWDVLAAKADRARAALAGWPEQWAR